MPSTSYIIGSATIWSQKPGVVYEYLTSTLYPIEGIEELDVRASIPEAWIMHVPVEPLDIAPVIISASLNTIFSYHDYTHPAEDLIDVTIAIISAALDVVVIEHDQPGNSLDTTMVVTSALLIGALVEYTHPLEDIIDLEIAITSASLGVV